MMRRFIAFVVFLALLVIAVPGLHPKAEAANLIKVGKFWIGQKYYIMNAQKVDMDVAPYVDSNDRTMVPLRFLAESLGAVDQDVYWDDSRQAANINFNGNALKFSVGNNTYTVNGADKTMDTVPVMSSDRVFLPARYVAEALGYDVLWNEDAQSVTMVPHGDSVAPVMIPDPHAYVDFSKPTPMIPDGNKTVVKAEPARVIESVLGIKMDYGSAGGCSLDPLNAWYEYNGKWYIGNENISYGTSNYDSRPGVPEEYRYLPASIIIGFSPRNTTYYKDNYPGLKDPDIEKYKPIIAAYFPNDFNQIYDNLVKYYKINQDISIYAPDEPVFVIGKNRVAPYAGISVQGGIGGEGLTMYIK